jgi:hypothetical protein
MAVSDIENSLRLRLLVASQQTVELAKTQQWQTMSDAEVKLEQLLREYIAQVGIDAVSEDRALADALLTNQQLAQDLLRQAQSTLTREFTHFNQQLRATQQYLKHPTT